MAQGRRYRLLTPADRRSVEERLADGVLARVVAGEFGCSVKTVSRVRADAVLRRQRRQTDSGFRLSIEERIEIAMRVAAGESNAVIARGLGRHRSTIGRELARCGRRRGHYAPFAAERRARRLGCRPKASKLSSPRLLAEVEAGLLRQWSPQQISARLRVDYPDDLEMRISHETIYQSLFVQSRGALRKQLTAELRTGRKTRKPQGTVKNGARIAGMVNISERPAEVEDRAVPGHWEGDLIIGAGQHSAVLTLVERQTRFVMLARLGYERGTELVINALKGRVGQLPAHLARSLTWDQGAELAAHQRFTNDTGIQVYFCDPHSPWQRGSNENTNGLLRQYLPKGTDLAVHDQAALDRISDRLNGRPRHTLGWANPAEKMAELLEATPQSGGA